MDTPAATTTPPRSVRNAVIAVILAFAAGATDAFAFLNLSGVFTANMTGNLVLSGLIYRPGYGTSIAGIVTAILVFSAALFVALRFLRQDAPTTRTVVVLAVAALAQLVLAGLWTVHPPSAEPFMVVPLIALSSIAMASQTTVARRIDTASGVTTTYVTGTITSLMADAADRKPQPAAIRVGVIVALVVGAICSAVLTHISPAFGAALPVAPALLAAILSATTLTPRPKSIVQTT